MQISTDGRCPSCGSHKFTSSVTTDGITVSCCDCSSYYIRLTGADAIGHRKVNPEKPGIFTGEAIIDATNEALDLEKKLESAWKTAELSECVYLLEQLIASYHENPYHANEFGTGQIRIPCELYKQACAKIESLKKFLATKV